LNHYKKTAKDYDVCHTSGFYSYLNDFEAGCIDSLGIEKAAVVEVGCGTGLVMQQIKARGHFVIGVDPCFEMAKYAADRGFSVFISDAENLPAIPGVWDVVCCFKTFPHLEDSENALLEFSRVAKQFVVVEFYNRNSLMFLWRRLFPKPVQTTYYSFKEFERLLPFDLQVERVEGCMVFFPSNVFWRKWLGWIEKICPRWLKNSFGSHIVVTCKKVL